MAINRCAFNRQSPDGQRLAQALNDFERGRHALIAELGTMAATVDGATNNEANFTYTASRYGTDTNAHAKGLFDQLNEIVGRLNTDGSVTNVKTAVDQALDYTR